MVGWPHNRFVGRRRVTSQLLESLERGRRAPAAELQGMPQLGVHVGMHQGKPVFRADFNCGESLEVYVDNIYVTEIVAGKIELGGLVRSGRVEGDVATGARTRAAFFVRTSRAHASTSSPSTSSTTSPTCSTASATRPVPNSRRTRGRAHR